MEVKNGSDPAKHWSESAHVFTVNWREMEWRGLAASPTKKNKKTL